MMRPLTDIYSGAGINIDTTPVDAAMRRLAGYDGLAVGTELLDQDDHDDTHDNERDAQGEWTESGLAACGFRVVSPCPGRAKKLANGAARRGKAPHHNGRISRKRALPGADATECLGGAAPTGSARRADPAKPYRRQGKATSRTRKACAGMEHLPGRTRPATRAPLNPVLCVRPENLAILSTSDAAGEPPPR